MSTSMPTEAGMVGGAGEELSDSALLDTDSGEEEGGGEGMEGWEEVELQLDLEEDEEDTGKPQREVYEGEEVKDHTPGGVEEGELSSGEEGEIKDEIDESPFLQHPSHTCTSLDHISQVTPTGDHGNNEPDKRVPPMEPDSGDSEEGEGVTVGGAVGCVRGRDEDGSPEEVSADSGKATRHSRRDGASPAAQPVEPRPGGSDGPHRDSRGTAVCRHFLQGVLIPVGKCSWGKDCRFSHDEHAVSSYTDLHTGPPAAFFQPRFPPPHGPRGPPHRFMMHNEPFLHPPAPHSMRLSPQGPPPTRHPPPIEGAAREPFRMPYSQQKQRLSGRGDKVGVSQVEEESEGWYRLRTVANQWSSDEDMPRRAQDLRHKLQPEKCGRAVRKQKNFEEDEEKEHRQRQKRKKAHRTERESSTSSDSEESDTATAVARKKRGRKGHSVTSSKRSSLRKEEGSGSESSSVGRMTSGKRKRRRHSSSLSSEDDVRGYPYPPPPPHHLPPHLHMPPHHHLHGPPDDRCLPHGPSGNRILHGPPSHQRHIPMDPYSPPHLHPHMHYFDRFGPPSYPGYDEWSRGPHSPPHPPRDHLPHRAGVHAVSPERWRRWKTRQYSMSSDSSPERHRQHRKKSSRHKKTDKTLDRKEQLLQELSVINTVIERKRQKKHRQRTPPDNV